MPKLTERQRFRRHVAKLNEHCPVAVPVKVHRVKSNRLPKGSLGDCWAVHSEQGHLTHFSIRIPSDVDYQLQIQLLIHEWAHAVAWTPQNGPGTVDDHDALWGVAYARVYRESE